MKDKKPSESTRQGYEVGYGRPPVSTRFQKGQSGNPRGRPCGSGMQQINKLILKEAYRLVSVREGERAVRMPAIQAVARSQIALAAKGNGPAQRAVLANAQAIESVSPPPSPPAVVDPKMSPLEEARRVAFLLAMGKAEIEKEKAREQISMEPHNLDYPPNQRYTR